MLEFIFGKKHREKTADEKSQDEILELIAKSLSEDPPGWTESAGIWTNWRIGVTFSLDAFDAKVRLSKPATLNIFGRGGHWDGIEKVFTLTRALAISRIAEQLKKGSS